VCVSGCALERKALLLCSVMSAVLVPSRNSYGNLEDLGTPVCRECCITEHKQAVPTNVCAEQYFTPTSTGQDIHPFCRISWTITVVLILYIDQITFISRSHKRYFFNSISILSSSIFTRNSAALYALSNICGTYCFCTNPLVSFYILN